MRDGESKGGEKREKEGERDCSWSVNGQKMTERDGMKGMEEEKIKIGN